MLSNLHAHRGRVDRGVGNAISPSGGAVTIDRTFLPMDGTAFYDEQGENSTCEWFTPAYIFDNAWMQVRSRPGVAGPRCCALDTGAVPFHRR